MTNSSPYLTKSRFTLALDCPTKLFYAKKRSEYANQKNEDGFLKALADGGFQVGELAKLMFPGGKEIKSETHEQQIAETKALLNQENAIIFEAAIDFGDYFIRIDILKKTGNKVELIEVKAKSFDSRNPGDVTFGELKKYLFDVAFQRYVLSKAHPEFEIRSFLMMADKSKVASVDGLNQFFKIQRTSAGSRVEVKAGLDLADIGDPILEKVCVDSHIDEIQKMELVVPGFTGGFEQACELWARHYKEGVKIPPTIGRHCKKCEFRCGSDANGLKDGFKECWQEVAGWVESDFNDLSLLDIFDLNYLRRDALFSAGIHKAKNVPKSSLKIDEAEQGISRSDRQLMQITGKWPGGGNFYLDRELIRMESLKWKPPLHFIDFETCRVAVPFFKGQKPYENIAFQYSHHIVNVDGTVVHASEFLSTVPGKRPNYDFVRALKESLGETGTVFMWSPHENTTLRAILNELSSDESPPNDADELREFLLSLTFEKNKGKVVPNGERPMYDLCDLAGKCYYHPMTKGSSSIKQVLPSVIAESDMLQTRYGKSLDPYKSLPPVFEDVPKEVLESFESPEDLTIKEGGAASAAYTRLQFDTLSLEERQRIENALKAYCKLDTLAMVMIYQAWMEWAKE